MRFAIAAMLTLVMACRESPEARTKRVAAECRDQRALLGSAAQRTTTEALIRGCSEACDGGDDESCGNLEEAVRAYCQASPEPCARLCDMKPNSLSKAACRHAK